MEKHGKFTRQETLRLCLVGHIRNRCKVAAQVHPISCCLAWEKEDQCVAGWVGTWLSCSSSAACYALLAQSHRVSAHLVPTSHPFIISGSHVIGDMPHPSHLAHHWSTGLVWGSGNPSTTSHSDVLVLGPGRDRGDSFSHVN